MFKGNIRRILTINKGITLTFLELTEMKFINNFKLKFKVDSLNIPAIFIALFTFTISILLAFMLIDALLDSYQLISDFTGKDIAQYINTSNIILPLAKNSIKNKIKTSYLNLAYNLDSPIFRELLSILSNNPINQEPQLRIEKFLQNQVLDLTKLKLSNPNITYNKLSIYTDVYSSFLVKGSQNRI